jgi:hypothetical protein
MNWTPYLEECLCILEKTKEYPSDSLLVCLVQLQLLCNRILTVNWNPDDSGNTKPQELYMKTFESHLDQLKQSFPPELKSNGDCAIFCF